MAGFYSEFDSLYEFTPSEMRLYSLANKKRWTESESTEVIYLLRDPSFLRRDIVPDLQSRVMLNFSYFFISFHGCKTYVNIFVHV